MLRRGDGGCIHSRGQVGRRHGCRERRAPRLLCRSRRARRGVHDRLRRRCLASHGDGARRRPRIAAGMTGQPLSQCHFLCNRVEFGSGGSPCGSEGALGRARGSHGLPRVRLCCRSSRGVLTRSRRSRILDQRGRIGSRRDHRWLSRRCGALTRNEGGPFGGPRFATRDTRQASTQRHLGHRGSREDRVRGRHGRCGRWRLGIGARHGGYARSRRSRVRVFDRMRCVRL